MKEKQQSPMLCIFCHMDALQNCYSDAGRRETEISQLCERCFDDIFKDEEE